MSTKAALAAVLGSSLTRTFTELIIFGYVPLHLYGEGERRILALALITAVPALVRFVAANAWGALADVTGRYKVILVTGLAGYAAASVGLLFVRTGTQAMAVVTGGAVLFLALSPAGKSLVSLRPGETYRALAWWLQLESWGWLLGSFVVGVRADLGLPASGLLMGVAALALAQALWVAVAVDDPPRERGLSPWQATAGGSRWLWQRASEIADDCRRLYRHGALAMVFAIFGLAVLAGEASFVVFGFYVTGPLGGTERLYGFTTGLATALGLGVYALADAKRRRLAPDRLLLAGATGYVVLDAAMATARHPLVAAVAYGLPVYAVVRIGATWAAGSLTGRRERGGGMGGLDGAEALATALAGVVAGIVGDSWGLRAVYWTCVVVALVLTGLAWRLSGRLRGALALARAGGEGIPAQAAPGARESAPAGP